MLHSISPGQTFTLTVDGIPTGVDAGYQIMKATSDTVVQVRTDIGIVERPIGSGNFVVVGVGPAEGDLYLLVVDWNGGDLTPETTKVVDLKVSTEVEPGESGLGAVADYAKVNMGGETWNALTTDADFGSDYVVRVIELIKSRVFPAPPDTAGESELDPRVLDYLGILVALQLIPAARDYWGSQVISVTRGDDASETVTYANRASLMNLLRDDLMRILPAAQAAALPLIGLPVEVPDSAGPLIDEDDCMVHVTRDPRHMPRERYFPHRGPPIDDFGFGPRRSGVRIG